jgi:hypothetical protein
MSHVAARFHRTALQRCFFFCLFFFRRHALRRLFDFDRAAAADFAAFDRRNGLNRNFGACTVVDLPSRRCRCRRGFHWAANRAHPVLAYSHFQSWLASSSGSSRRLPMPAYSHYQSWAASSSGSSRRLPMPA